MQQEFIRPGAWYSGVAKSGRPWAVLPRGSVAGGAMIAAAWAVSWAQVQPLAPFYFFPLWLGYILLVDGIVLARRGMSLLQQGAGQFLALFAISAVFWWAYEALNIPVQNWRYLGIEQYSTLQYSLFATLPFSTVLPAVLETATLLGSFGPSSRYLVAARVPPPRRLWLLVTLGVGAAVAPWFWPSWTYPLIWCSLFLVVDPINWWVGRPSISRLLRADHTSMLLTLGASGLTCGFFWEMWNYYSYPKWIYVLPGISAPKLFEMPLPGYLGYVPFALELYAMYNLVLFVARRSSPFERVMQAP